MGISQCDDGQTYPLFSAVQVFIASNLAQQLATLEQEFGMTPAARTRIQLSFPEALPISYGDKERFSKNVWKLSVAIKFSQKFHRSDRRHRRCDDGPGTCDGGTTSLWIRI